MQVYFDHSFKSFSSSLKTSEPIDSSMYAIVKKRAYYEERLHQMLKLYLAIILIPLSIAVDFYLPSHRLGARILFPLVDKSFF
jgi:hypothetical protein